MKVEWKVGGKDVQSSDDVYTLVSKGNNHSLIIEEVYPEDTGLYICKVFNGAGEAETTCKLEVIGKSYVTKEYVMVIYKRYARKKNVYGIGNYCFR